MAFMRSGVRSPSAPPNNHSISPAGDIDHPREWWISLAAGALLFLATAAVVFWQNSRVAAIWDLSYILENAHRISLGAVPYRDFPFPFPPLTFLIQAAIIKFTGRVFWHTIVYCAVLGGLATVLTWRIIFSVLRETFSRPRLLAFALTLPVIALGIYCVFPHPFYDPDCTFAILLGLYLLQRVEQRPSLWREVSAGMALVIPLFVKQNTGLAFLFSTGLALVVLITIEIIRKHSPRRYLFVLMSALATLVLAVLLIQLTVGLRNYWYWTIQFAAARRTPAPAEMMEVYQDKFIFLWLAIFAVGAIVAWLTRGSSKWLALLSGLMMASPFAWPTIYLLCNPDPSERADRLLLLWPVLLIISLFVAVATIRRRRGLSLVLPFILLFTIHGAFLSQQLWGSTYAIWPLFMILFASTVSGVSYFHLDSALVSAGLAAGLVPQPGLRTSPPATRLKDLSSWLLCSLTAVSVLSLLISGAFYVSSNERLSYLNIDEGQLRHSTLPQLRGLSTRGDWIPNFEELVRYTDRTIPRDDGILIRPGEDLFYYTTGRRPRFPVLMFDHTVNPYSPEEIRQLVRDRNIRWLIVKQDLQNEEDEVETEKDRLTEDLEKDFEQVESLNNYDIYRRNDSAKSSDNDK